MDGERIGRRALIGVVDLGARGWRDRAVQERVARLPHPPLEALAQVSHDRRQIKASDDVLNLVKIEHKIIQHE